MIEPEIAFADLSDNATLAEALLKFTFEALLKERQEDLAFFDERIEKGLIAKLEGIVGSQFVRMDYGEAVAVLERAKEKFEFPVKWGMDLQSEHERYLTETEKPLPNRHLPIVGCIEPNPLFTLSFGQNWGPRPLGVYGKTVAEQALADRRLYRHV